MDARADIAVRGLSAADAAHVVTFADHWIGRAYFTVESLCRTFGDGVWAASFGAFDAGELVGIRLTLPPERAAVALPQPVTPEGWKHVVGAPVSWSEVAYFKSLFVAATHQGHGLARRMSLDAIEQLRVLGAKAVVCHSWVESPGDSSRRFLSRFGFRAVRAHPGFWSSLAYACARCSPPPSEVRACSCTALEMVLPLVTG